jgi:hypothetical protein
MKILKIFLPTFIATLSGCGTYHPLPESFAPTQVEKITPAINQESEAEIGETIISKSYTTVYPAVILDQEALDSKILPPFTVAIPPGKHRLRHIINGDKYYSNPPANSGIYVPSDKSKQPSIYYWQSLDGKFLIGETVSIKEINEEISNSSSFRRELIYGGLSGKTVTINYREFKDDLARPAFSQELKYDLSQEDVIGFRGARFKIIKATNTKLVYKIIKQLE